MQLTTLYLTLAISAALFLGGIAALVTVRALELRRLFKKRYICIELTPPTNSHRTPQATEQLFAVLHGIGTPRTPASRLLRRKMSFALEVVSHRKTGIRYIVRLAAGDEAKFRRTIAAYLPQVRIKTVPDYLTGRGNYRFEEAVDFKQRAHFAFPLKQNETAAQHDPIAYLAGSMTNLQETEQIAFQIVLEPSRIPEANRLSRRSANNQDFLLTVGGQKHGFIGSLLRGFGSIVFHIVEGVLDGFYGSSSQGAPKTTTAPKPTRQLSSFEQQLAEAMHGKVNKPLFYASVRTLVVMDSAAARDERITEMRGSLQAFSMPEYQALVGRYNFPAWLLGRYRLFLFRYRLPALLRRNACVLDTSEVANLYHFPYDDTAKTEGLVKHLSRQLPPPLSLRNTEDFDVVVARNYYHGKYTDIGLTRPERQRHMYVIGGTGNGKTTFLEYEVIQDIRNGKGVAVIDPHGDMAEKLLRFIPKERINDVVYFNPDDLGYPLGLNLLELAPGLTGDDLLREKDRVTEAAVEVFRKLFSGGEGGASRIEYMLRNAIQSSFYLENPTIFTVWQLINDPDFLKNSLAKITDQRLRNFWDNEFSKAGDYQQVKMAAGVTSKIGRFFSSASVRRVLGQPRSTINFDEILNGKILICNFSKGRLIDTSSLFGIVTLAKIQLAANRRALISKAARKEFYVVVDEFQNFATTSFVEMLAESRKYAVYLTMAEQTTSQQSDRQLVNIIMANVGTVVCFRTANPADEQMLLPMFQPLIQPGEIANLPSYNFYIRMAAIHSQEPTSGETIVTDDADGSDEVAAAVIKASRTQYSADPAVIAEIEAQNTPSEPRAAATADRKRPRRPKTQAKK